MYLENCRKRKRKESFFSSPSLSALMAFLSRGPLALPPLSFLGQPSRARQPRQPSIRCRPSPAEWPGSNRRRASLPPSAADGQAPCVSAFLLLQQPSRTCQAAEQQPPPRPHFGRGSVSPRAPAATNGSPYPPPFPLLLLSPFLLALAAETASQRLVGFAVRPSVSHAVLVPSLSPVSPMVSSPCPSLSPRASLASVRGF